MTSFWTTHYATPHLSAHIAATAEAQGWDGVVFTDSQHLNGDVYAALAVAATVTERIGLGTGVTNTTTRHPAVTASAIATIQVLSDGRAALGIGRGDSALANLGLPPAPVSQLQGYLGELQSYLAGVAVEQHGFAKAIDWIAASGQPKVPVDVAASGPRVIDAAGRLADGVSLAVGADVDRLSVGIERARRAAEAAGRDPSALAAGAYLVVAAHDDPAVARDAVRGSVGTQAHFSGMAGAPTHLLDPSDRAVVEALSRTYELARHGDTRASHLDHLTDDFVDRFAIIGSPAECTDRLGSLLDAVPLDRVIIAARSRGVDQSILDDVGASTARAVDALR